MFAAMENQASAPIEEPQDAHASPAPAPEAACVESAGAPEPTASETPVSPPEPEFVGSLKIDGEEVPMEVLVKHYRNLRDENLALRKEARSAVARRRQEKRLKPFQAELIKLQHYLEHTNRRMIIIFEGRDAAGKGGTIRRVTRYMNEKHYRIIALARPTELQKSQWYFQRYVQQFPRGGEAVLFDRSWYNRSMVEPVFGFCTAEEYENFMIGVRGFENDLVRHGTLLVKLYFSVSKEEQARRFERRRNDPLRQWKLSEVDLQAQEHWDDFTKMKYEMLRRTHTANAPWVMIRSDNKDAARLNAIKVILNSVPYANRDPELDFVPNDQVVISGARELELMEAQRIRTGKFTD